MRRYGTSSMNPQGTPESAALCVETVNDVRGWVSRQCSRKRGYGPQAEYCKQHAKRLRRHAATKAPPPELEYADYGDLTHHKDPR